ncbi:MAG: hypothetical protein ACREON_00395 [Gemmatimonadaceae bacterium]
MIDLFTVIGFLTFPLSIAFGVAWWMTRGELRQLRAGRSLAVAPIDRFERLEHAVEAIGLEVERISEGQRFTTKLLAERTTPDRPGVYPRAERITPH